MKKLLLILLLLSLSAISFAKETVTIIYGFSPADTQANYSRTLVEEANRIQDKYTFLFDTKPGAGSSIAAKYVEHTPNTILGTSAAFFIRPNFFPNESHDVNNFKELMPQCNAPMAVGSIKYKSWRDVPKNKTINVGVSGMGATSHLASLQLKTQYPDIQPIPFKSTNDSVLSLVGGQIDLHVGFLGEMNEWVNKPGDGKMIILGVTGLRPLNGNPTLVSQGFPSVLSNMDNPQHLVVSNNTPVEKFKEWRSILVKAAQAKSVQKSYAIDFCKPLDQMTDAEIQPWYLSQTHHWSKLASTVKLDK